MTQSRWYVLAVGPGTETQVSRILRNLGFTVELFAVEDVRVHRRTKKVLRQRRPLFPGYLFCRIAEHWPPTRELSGAVGFLRASRDEEPKAVSDEAIAVLMEAAVRDGRDDRDPGVEIGDWLTIDLFGHQVQAVVERLKSNAAVLRADWHGKNVAVEQPLQRCRAA